MKKIIVLLMFVFAGLQSVYACKCAELAPFSRVALSKYDVIFVGKVVAVSGDDIEAKASFRVDELYKGECYQQITVQYDAETDCAMNFVPGDTWVIYGKWVAYGMPRVDICSYSRLKMKDGQTDYYADGIRASYESEVKWLKDSLGIQPYIDPAQHKDLGHKNEIPGATQAIVYLIAGFGGLAIIFYFVRRLFKRDGK